MNAAIVVALVLLPVAMYGLALLLAAIRSWVGITALPRARHLVRALRARQPAGRPHGRFGV